MTNSGRRAKSVPHLAPTLPLSTPAFPQQQHAQTADALYNLNNPPSHIDTPLDSPRFSSYTQNSPTAASLQFVPQTPRKNSLHSRLTPYITSQTTRHDPKKYALSSPSSPTQPTSQSVAAHTTFSFQSLFSTKVLPSAPYQKNPLTLTFKDWTLEKKFLHTSLYGTRLWRFRLFLIGAIIVNALFIFVDIFQVDRSNVGVWPYYTNISLRVFSILVGLLHYPFIWRPNAGIFWTEYFTAAPIFAFLACTMIQSVLTTNFKSNKFPVGAVLIIIATYMLPRLRSIVYYPLSVAVSCVFILSMIIVHGISLVSDPLPLSRIIVFCIIIVLSQSIAFVLNFMNEYYTRFVFILNEDLLQETQSLRDEKERSQALLENILPAHLTHKVKSDNSRFIHMYSDITALFSDLVQFTNFSSTVTAEELIAILNKQFSCFDQLCKQHNLEKIKTVGDAFFAIGGSVGTSADHSVDCIGLGLAMIEALNDMNLKYGWNFEIRVGVACGNGLLSVLGRGKLTFDVFGEAVKQSEKMEESSLPGRVHVTSSVYRRAHKYFMFERHTLMADTESYLVVRKKAAFSGRAFRPVEVEEVTFQSNSDTFGAQSAHPVSALTTSVPDFLSINTENFLESCSRDIDDTLPDVDDTEDDEGMTEMSDAPPASIKPGTNKSLASHDTWQNPKLAKTNPATKHTSIQRSRQKVLSVELQRFFLTEEDYETRSSPLETELPEDKKHHNNKPSKSTKLNMKLNRFTLTFDWPTSVAFYKEAYSARRTNLKIMFFLIFFFNVALCAGVMAIFNDYIASPTFILWYSFLLITFLATMVYMLPFVSKYALSGVVVCTWFVLSNSFFVYFMYILPYTVWDQLIGIVGCWAILSLNIFPTIPFVVKVALNVPLCVVVIAVDFIFALVDPKAAFNPFLYGSLLVQTVIQLFGSYVADFTQANVFILRNRQKLEKKNIVREQLQNNMVIESVLPHTIAERLRGSANGSVDRPFISDFIKSGSILFAEFSGFEIGTVIDPVVAVGILNDLFSLFDMVTVNNQTFKVKSIGATYLTIAGLNNDSFHALHLANTAIEIRNQARKVLAYYKKKVLFRDVDVGIKIGCHSGSFSCGVVGETRYLFDTFGDSINVASRLKSTSELDKIQCSAEFYESIKNSFVLYPRGEVYLKGKGVTQTYWLVRSNEQQSDQWVQTDITADMVDNLIVTSSATQIEFDTILASAVEHEVAELQLLHAERVEEYRQQIARLKRKIKNGEYGGAEKSKRRKSTRGKSEPVVSVADDVPSRANVATHSEPAITPLHLNWSHEYGTSLDSPLQDWNSLHVSEDDQDKPKPSQHRRPSVPALRLSAYELDNTQDEHVQSAHVYRDAAVDIGFVSKIAQTQKVPHSSRTPRSKTVKKKVAKRKKSLHTGW